MIRKEYELSTQTGTLPCSSHCPRSPAPTEEWRSIPGSEGLYSVSSLGRVRSEPIQTSRAGRRRGRILKCPPDSKGYPQFGMSLHGGHRRTMKVHRAVALAFLVPRPDGHQINHKSGDKFDNSVGNLEYVTCKQNIRHGWRNGLYSGKHSIGEKNNSAKLTTANVRQIRHLARTLDTTELARRFGVTKANICMIIKRKTWKHVA